MIKNAAFALVFVCLVFPFTCAAEEPRPGPIETVQLQPDQQAGSKAEPSEGAGPVPGEAPAEPKPVEPHCQEYGCPKLLGLQFNGVYQNMPPFRSAYQGVNSLSFRNGEGQDVTHTYGVYFGSQLARNLQVYVDAEMFMGYGISNGLGLGGYVNGDVIRAGSSNLPKIPYLARYYFRYFVPLSSETENVEWCMDQLPGEQPVSRWEIKVGKLALTDDKDGKPLMCKALLPILFVLKEP